MAGTARAARAAWCDPHRGRRPARRARTDRRRGGAADRHGHGGTPRASVPAPAGRRLPGRGPPPGATGADRPASPPSRRRRLRGRPRVGRGLGEFTAGRLDLAVVAFFGPAPELPPRVRAHRLLPDPMVVVLPDDHLPAARTSPGSPLRLERLRGESWVAIPAGHSAREQLDRAAGEAVFRPRVRFETESYDVAQGLVGAGSGVALVSRLALTDTPAPRTANSSGSGRTARSTRSPRPTRRSSRRAADGRGGPAAGPPVVRYGRPVPLSASASWRLSPRWRDGRATRAEDTVPRR
ncbi:LysR family transcriptional regulator substrate-binding protein [Streptomyces monashensis]|uniref:LysR family transcriptional regulator substrate-binding protein n=1 Tax=Streptomyces monashensis TaxID=1678012 RepID=UPI0015A60B35